MVRSTKMSGTSSNLSDDLVTLRLRWPGLAAELAPIDGLSGVLVWGGEAGLPVRDMQVVTQDEYTHDAILPWQGRWLVFGLT